MKMIGLAVVLALLAGGAGAQTRVPAAVDARDGKKPWGPPPAYDAARYFSTAGRVTRTEWRQGLLVVELAAFDGRSWSLEYELPANARTRHAAVMLPRYARVMVQGVEGKGGCDKACRGWVWDMRIPQEVLLGVDTQTARPIDGARLPAWLDRCWRDERTKAAVILWHDPALPVISLTDTEMVQWRTIEHGYEAMSYDRMPDGRVIERKADFFVDFGRSGERVLVPCEG